jgi:protein O-GlcNAcase / histone acetyltransferase
MTDSSESQFLSGVIEGFYGPPWTPAERHQLWDWMTRSGLNTYFYGPKDDLHQRAIWRQPYHESGLMEVREAVAACRQRGLKLIYACSPGLDVTYSDPADMAAIQGRLTQLLDDGVSDFCILLDDIPDAMRPGDLARWGSLAAAQAAWVNDVYTWTRARTQGRFLVCPTPYCGRMVAARHGGEGYLGILGQGLHPDIDIFWTGPEIISETLDVAPIARLTEILRRPPLIWDNLFANDYDGRRFFCGPYAGRPLELKQAVRGILLNPNTEFPLNFVPIHSFGAYLAADGAWDSRASFLEGLQAWWPRFATVGVPLSFEDLVTFADCFYLPYQEGPEADALAQAIARCLSSHRRPDDPDSLAVRARMLRLKDFCARLVDLKDRSLFHAFHRRVWELREELDLIDRWWSHRIDLARAGTPFESDFHRPKTYRGGFVVRLQSFLNPQPDGSMEWISLNPGPETAV